MSEQEAKRAIKKLLYARGLHNHTSLIDPLYELLKQLNTTTTFSVKDYPNLTSTLMKKDINSIEDDGA